MTTGFEPVPPALTGQCTNRCATSPWTVRSGAGIRTPIAALTGQRPAVERHPNKVRDTLSRRRRYRSRSTIIFYVQMTQLICDQCGKLFKRRTSAVNQAKQRGNLGSYCSRACLGLSKRRRKVVSAACRQCGSIFSRRSHGRKERAMFCSQKCAALYSSARRATNGPICAACGGQKSHSGDICQACRKLQFTNRTIGELRAQSGTFAFHAKVRGLARTAYKGPRECAACGYSRHVDICHIRDVASFPDTATVGEVNDPTNLVALDKRCHWEFDHGYLAYVGSRIVAGAGLEPAASWL
jgi:hypothetical protein